MAVLYVIATPIGNLKDITLRALESFKAVEAIACEDTRYTRRLLTHYEIQKPLISCRSQNEAIVARRIINLLDEGKNVAYASDCGTPSVSDPGAVLVRLVREAGHIVSPIPGASASVALISIAGSFNKTVIFEGFLSPKGGRRKRRLNELMALNAAIIVYESPFRIVKLLTDIAEIDSERQIVIGRELTKLHEETIMGSASEILNDLSSRSTIKGEFSVFIAGKA